MKIKVNMLLSLIAVVAFIVRIIYISDLPPGFFADEASIGFNAYRIMTTGKDEHGEILPIFFKSFGDYRHPIVVYTTIPFILVFGFNETSVRVTSVAYGVLTILLLYAIGKELHSRTLGLWAAFIAASMPWLIHYNRVGFEFSSYAFFFTFTFYIALKSIDKKSYIIPTCILTGITIYTYQPAKLILPAFFLGMLFLLRKQYMRNAMQVIFGLVLLLIISIPLIHSFINGSATQRFNQISIFSHNSSIQEIIKISIANYITQLSPNYFFITGEGNNMTRHFIEGLLPLLIISAPFLYIGLFLVFVRIKIQAYQLLFLWLLLYPLSGAVVYESPFTSRSIIGGPLVALIVALSIVIVIKKIELTKIQYAISFVIIMLFAYNFFVFLQFYFIQYPLKSAGFYGWQYGAREIVQYFKENESKYDELIMSPEFNAPEIFFKFYAPHACSKCKVGFPDTNYHSKRKQLFAVTPSYLSSHTELSFQSLKMIYYPNGSIAFQIGKIVQ